MEPAVIVAHLLVLWSVIGEPLWGRHCYRILKRDVARDPGARIRFYRAIVVVEWAWLPVIGLVLWLYPAPLTAIGFSIPAAGLPGWIFVGIVTALILIQTAIMVMSRERFADDPKVADAMRHVWHMLPRSASDHVWWIGVSVTAGICEEILYRGFLFFYFREIWGQNIWVALVASSFVFALAHVYQGIRGAATTAAVGLVVGSLYAVTGSLLIPVVLHVIIDARTLVLIPAPSSDDEQTD
jgi:membrane protease YdiL (CAAX protease family)